MCSKSLPAPPAAFQPFESLEQTHAATEERLDASEELAARLGALETEIRVGLAYICGLHDDRQHVELYDGTLGVPRDYVDRFEPGIGQLQWVDLNGMFTGAGERPGNVSGARWGSGALLDRDDELFLTAGHCFSRWPPNGWRVPRRNKLPIPSQDIARLMKVNFNYQLDGPATKAGNKTIRSGISFPVVELVELHESIDYAVVRLGEREDGMRVRDLFRGFRLAAADLKTVGATLCIIQHPNGDPKKIEAGTLKEANLGRIAYDDLDTGGGASGAPILSADGEIVGIHTDGHCLPYGGFNSGVAIGVVRSVSNVL